MSGKGDKPRPVNGERYRQGYERIFGSQENDKCVNCEREMEDAESLFCSSECFTGGIVELEDE